MAGIAILSLHVTPVHMIYLSIAQERSGPFRQGAREGGPLSLDECGGLLPFGQFPGLHFNMCRD